MVRLLHNALRVDEACTADLADLAEDRGHRVLTVLGKGNRKAKIPLTPGTCGALDAYLADRAGRAGLEEWRRLSGPLLATETGGRRRQSHLWDLVRRLARAAGIPGWEQISPHSLRHSAITFALDAGVALRDVQDYARHRDPRTTRRYDYSRDSLDCNAAYAVAAYLGLDVGRCSAGRGPPRINPAVSANRTAPERPPILACGNSFPMVRGVHSNPLRSRECGLLTGAPAATPAAEPAAVRPEFASTA